MEVRLRSARRARPRGARGGQRGQAAVTDALYFLLIITALAVFLFVFANGYGSSVSQSLQRKYEVDFASSAMEALFNQSIPRDANTPIDRAREADYLLAALKEDYADDLQLNETGSYLAKSISEIMSPISNARDYLFFLYRDPCGSSPGPNCKDFVYVLLKTSRIPCQASSGSCARLEVCLPPNGHPELVQNLLLGLSNTSQSESRVIFVQGSAPITVRASLVMWPSTQLNPSAVSAMNCSAVP